MIKKIVLSILGFLLLIIALIGLFIPIWPTTPFVLLSIACFSSNQKVRTFLLKNKFISDHYNNYTKREGLKKSSVIISLGFLWIVLVFSMILIKTNKSFLLLFSVGIAVTIHLIWMSKPKQVIKE